jgi:hypothetical protein
MSEEIDELTGNEGGRWRVVSRNSTYVFDLDAMTTTRIPGPTAGLTLNDTTRPIRGIDSCKVGERGYWTMLAENGDLDTIDYFWQACSIIRRIERINADDEVEG